MRLERIVVGTDFSDASIAAARWAVRRFAPGAEVVLAHVISVPERPRFMRGGFPPVDTLVSTARVGAEARLRELSASLGAERIWLEVPTGVASEQLAEIAARYDADVIVVGKHGERGGLWSRIGGTAETLVRGSSVPVLLATGLRDTKLRHVLAALDDSDVAPAVAAWARHLATRDHALLLALHVVSGAVVGGALAAAGKEARSGTRDHDERDALRGDADRWIGTVVGPGLPRDRVASEVGFGHPGDEILAAAERESSDLIVMGSRGGGAARRLLLGSVASEVLRGARCPVLVVKEAEDEIVD